MTIQILWSPSAVLVDRVIRIPVQSEQPCTLESGPVTPIQISPHQNGVTRFFLKMPAQPGPLRLRFSSGGENTECAIQVVDWAACRTIHQRLGNTFPRRWPLGQPFVRSKTTATLPPEIPPPLSDGDWAQVREWLVLSDVEIWQCLPPAETPRCYTVNETDGCPQHGAEIFKFGGFYPWRHDLRNHPGQVICPVGGEKYPTNFIVRGDYISGDTPDDGYGYRDSTEHVFRFVGANTWPRIQFFLQGIQLLTQTFRQKIVPADLDPDRILDRLGFMLVRFAAEELYLAAVPQFRFGNLSHALLNREWGPRDSAGLPFPHAHPLANGTQEYCVPEAYVGASLAACYDSIYERLKNNPRLPDLLQPFGLAVRQPEDILQLVEEALACFIQHHLDGYSGTNHPGASRGTVICLRVLNSPNLADIMDFLYDTSDDQLRTLVCNGSYPDGLGYEASGGYSAGHILGTFDIHEQIEALRALQPAALPSDRYPPINRDRRFQLMADSFRTTVLCGRTGMSYGDDRQPGVMAEGQDRSTADLKSDVACATAWIAQSRFARQAFRHNPASAIWAQALKELHLLDEFPEAQDVLNRHPEAGHWPNLLLEHGGIGILRLRHPDGRDRAAVAHHFISQPFHRHDDFMDAQLVAFDRTWLFDLGYPATHDTCWYWEGQWAVHNRGHICDGQDEDVIGCGRCAFFLDTPQVSALATEGVEGFFQEWRYWTPQKKFHRRLLVLIPTVGDGLALVDLYQLSGGIEHWRTLLGPQGQVQVEGVDLRARPGTAAGPDIPRNARDRVPPSRHALTLIDQIRDGSPGPCWKATYTSHDRPDGKLDIHAVGSPAGLRLQTGRGTHPLTAPEDSPYRFSPLLLSRQTTPDQTTWFNLVMEPRLGAPTIRSVAEITAEGTAAENARGICLTLSDRTQITVLWSPEATPTTVTAFAGGIQLHGVWGFIREEPNRKPCISVAAGGALSTPSIVLQVQPRPPSGTVRTMDDKSLELTLAGDSVEKWHVGAWISIGPRKHWYRIESVQQGGQPDETRLRLNWSRVLSIARIHDIGPSEIGLDARLPLAWGDFFRDSHLIGDAGEPVIPIENIKMREDRPIAFAVLKDPAQPSPLARLQRGQWIKLVDFLPGDTVTFKG